MHRCEDLAAHPDVFVLVAVLSTSGDVEGTARQQVLLVYYQLGGTAYHFVVFFWEQNAMIFYPKAEHLGKELGVSVEFHLGVESFQ